MPTAWSDLLPGACLRRRGLTARLLSRLSSWGYAPVSPPALERYDLLARGLSEEDRRRCVRFVAPPDGRLLALRADVTPQLARMLAQRVGGSLPEDAVFRVSYAADVVRHPAGPADRAEVQQVGVELVGDDHAAADAELVLLASEALHAVGLPAHRVDLAHTGVATSMLDELGLSDALRAEVRKKLAHKDRDGLLDLPVPGDGAARVASLCDRFGPPTVLDGAAGELPAAAPAIERLSAIASAVAERADLSLTVDLGEVRGDDYYTGLRLRVWAPGVSRPVVRGGRYDGLLQRYGVSLPATGFAIDLDALEAALDHAGGGVVADTEPAACLVAVLDGGRLDARRAEAAKVAAGLRAQGQTAWVQPVASLARAQELATQAGADTLTVLAEDAAVAQYIRAPTGDGWVTTNENKD